MQFVTLDSIVNRSLLERGLSIHYYSEFLFHGASAIRELAKDTLKIVNAKSLKVNDYNSVDLPSDFKDDVAVCIPVNGLLQKIPKKDSINPIRVHNTETGEFVPYSNNINTNDKGLNLFGINTSYFWYYNVNEYGEATGGYFGANGGASTGYKVIKERSQIQLTGSFTGDNIVLLYVSNGQSIDNATQIEWDAFAAIQAYIDWKRSPNSAIKNSQEALTFYNEARKLRGNLNDLTLADIKQIIRSQYTATIKN